MLRIQGQDVFAQGLPEYYNMGRILRAEGKTEEAIASFLKDGTIWSYYYVAEIYRDEFE